MKKIALLSLLICLGMAAFAAFPIEYQLFTSEVDPKKFKLDTLGFILGILTVWLIPLYGLPLLLLFINKKNFRGSLAWGWLAGLLLVLLLVLVIFFIEEGASSILLY
tara:strand:+ start:151 stop:471 length:321 start_codon:yes stop_codon:yes gene_type:complete